MRSITQIDVLIVNPPSPDGHIYIRDICRWGRKSRERIIWPQTSLAYLAAMVPDGMSVEIIDAIAEEMHWTEFEKAIRDKQPSFYVSYVTGTTFDVDARGIKVAKEVGALTIAIGTHPSAVPKNTLDLIPELDMVIRHEPEFTFRDVLDRVREGRSLEGCLGTAIRNNGDVLVHEDRPLVEHLDELPIPKQHLLPLDKYRMPFIGKRYVWLLTNRGCPYRCTYCFEGVVWGSSVRYRSAESIIEEIEYLAEHDVHKVVFLADLFTYDRNGVMKMCDLLIEKRIKLKWACNSRVDTIDEEMARKMKQAGCWLVAMGIESGSQKVLDACKKDAKVEDAVETVGMLDRVGIKTWGYFIIGLPEETEETMQETIDFAKNLPLDIALFHVAVPYAGTDFYFQAVANGWLDTSDWSHFDMNDAVVMHYDNLSADKILAGTKRAFREFYFRPKQIWRLMRMMAGGGDIAMIWDICKGLLSWVWRKKEDRVAAEATNAGSPEGKERIQLDPELARGALHGATAVVEAPRTNVKTGKPSHKSYVQLQTSNAGGDGTA